MNRATTPDGAEMIVLSRAEYERLVAVREDAIDGALIDAARADNRGAPLMPADLVEAVLSGAMHPLAAMRRAAGLTAAQLAARARVRAATISDIENGKIDPRFGTVRALADALGTDVDDIMP